MAFFHSEDIVEREFFFSSFNQKTVGVKRENRRRTERSRSPQPQNHLSVLSGSQSLIGVDTAHVEKHSCNGDARQQKRQIKLSVFSDISREQVSDRSSFLPITACRKYGESIGNELIHLLVVTVRFINLMKYFSVPDKQHPVGSACRFDEWVTMRIVCPSPLSSPKRSSSSSAERESSAPVGSSARISFGLCDDRSPPRPAVSVRRKLQRILLQRSVIPSRRATGAKSVLISWIFFCLTAPAAEKYFP